MYESPKGVAIIYWTKRDNVAFHPKLRIGEAKSFVEGGTGQLRAFIGFPAKEQGGNAVHNGK